MAEKNKPQTFKLSPKQRNLFIALNRSFDSMPPEEKQARNEELKKILNTSQMINNAGLRDAFITKALGHSKYFNNYYKIKDLNPDFPIDSDYFKMISDRDIKTKDVKSIEDIEEGFYVQVLQNGQQHLVILECKETYLQHLVAFTGRQVIEKDYK